LRVPKVTAVVKEPLQSSWSAGWLTCPVGFTVMVKVFVGPAQPTEPLVKVGVTTMVATTGEVPVFTAVNDAILPVPEAARPMLVVVFVHAYVVVPPVLRVPKVTAVVKEPLHSNWSAGWLTCPVGFTVMVKVLVGPAQPTEPLVKVGVTTIVATTGEVPVFTAVNEAMFPVPDARSPIPGVSLVHA